MLTKDTKKHTRRRRYAHTADRSTFEVCFPTIKVLFLELDSQKQQFRHKGKDVLRKTPRHAMLEGTQWRPGRTSHELQIQDDARPTLREASFTKACG